MSQNLAHGHPLCHAGLIIVTRFMGVSFATTRRLLTKPRSHDCSAMPCEAHLLRNAQRSHVTSFATRSCDQELVTCARARSFHHGCLSRTQSVRPEAD